MTRWLAMVTLVVVAGAVRGWDCVCNPRECEPLEPSGCPGLGIVVWDPCSATQGPAVSIARGARNQCCKVCARTLGEDCGGFRGTCEPGLKCYEGSCTPIT